MTPETRERLRARLIVDEGVRLAAYLDSLGYLTIGVGRLIDQRKGGGITYDESLYLLDNDITRKHGDVMERLPQFDRLDSVRQVVLMSMAFQMGADGLAGFHNTLASVWRGDWDAAAAGMLGSKWATQTPERALRLARMMRTGRFE